MPKSRKVEGPLSTDLIISITPANDFDKYELKKKPI